MFYGNSTNALRCLSAIVSFSVKYHLAMFSLRPVKVSMCRGTSVMAWNSWLKECVITENLSVPIVQLCGCRIRTWPTCDELNIQSHRVLE